MILRKVSLIVEIFHSIPDLRLVVQGINQSLVFLQQNIKSMRSSLWSLLFFLGISVGLTAQSQCDSLIDILDPFDSTRTVATPTFNVGYTIASNFQTLDGHKMIEQGKILMAYAEQSKLSSFFLNLALAERNFQTIDSGKERVMLLLKNGRVIPLLNASDRGEFDSNTNMRIYTHTCVIPLDMIYLLSVEPIYKIRVKYNGGYMQTLELTPKQQEAMTQSILCIGERVGLFPKKP